MQPGCDQLEVENEGGGMQSGLTSFSPQRIVISITDADELEGPGLADKFQILAF